MSWPRAWYYAEIDGKQVLKGAWKVMSYDSERRLLVVLDRPLNPGDPAHPETRRYEEHLHYIPLEHVRRLNWEAHTFLGGILKDKVPCMAHGYGADAKAELALAEGYSLIR